MLTGEYKNTLDEKGRIMFPAKLRLDLSVSSLVITRGFDGCLWLFPPQEWKIVSDKIMSSASLFDAKARNMLRHFISPAQEIEIDKSGRISIPQVLRERAGLEKECYILCMNKFFELWSAEKYEKYLNENESQFIEAAEGWLDIGF